MRLYIADGHHRAAAAARVARQRRGNGAADASHESFLVVAFPHDEMRILDYNRVVRDTHGLSADDLLERIRGAFDIEPSRTPVAPATPETFGMYLAGDWYRLRVHAALVPRADPVASLDVSLLQDHLLAPILHIGDPRTDPRIDFVGGVRGLAELERRVDVGSSRRRVLAARDQHGSVDGGRRCGTTDAAEIDVVRAEARGRIVEPRAGLEAYNFFRHHV